MSSLASTWEPISPELALVCPELARAARRHPARQPWELAQERLAARAGSATVGPAGWAAAIAFVVVALAVRTVLAVSAVAAVVLVLTLLGG